MRGYNTGWCNFCNGSVCPCGSCGCGGNCSCSCGRQTVLQQSKSSCCNTSNGTKFCKEPLVYVTSNFTVPAVNNPLEIKVSDSSKLFIGEGIKIGSGYFQIIDIADSRTITIIHSGTATPGIVITALNPSYGCYAYPIYFAGLVEIDYTTEEIAGLDASYAVVADSVIDPVLTATYGYLGPDKISFNIYLFLEIDNTPDFVSLPLPNADFSTSAAFSVTIVESGVPITGIAFKQGTDLIVGLGAGTPFSNVSGTIIRVSGEYGV